MRAGLEAMGEGGSRCEPGERRGARGERRISNYDFEGRLVKKRWGRKTWEMLETCETRETARGGWWSEPG